MKIESKRGQGTGTIRTKILSSKPKWKISEIRLCSQQMHISGCTSLFQSMSRYETTKRGSSTYPVESFKEKSFGTGTKCYYYNILRFYCYRFPDEKMRHFFFALLIT